MATWQELSRDCLQAAKQLAGQGHLRSSVNRSYYAAYSAVTSHLVARGVRFAHGWNNPAHEQLPDFIQNNLSLSQDARRRLRKILRILRKAREDADYRPGLSIDRTLVLHCIRDAIAVLTELGIQEDETK